MIYRFKPTSFKELKKLPPNIQKRIINKLEFFLTSAEPITYADRLINSELGQYRFRIGDYRVIFDIEGETIIILSLGHRKEIYKR